MFLKEFEGRTLFQKYGIPVAKGVLVSPGNFQENLRAFVDREEDISEFVLKAQLLSGKRGKRGAIVFSSRDELFEKVEALFEEVFDGEKVEEILVQEKLSIQRELYLSVTIDRFLRKPVLVFSESGGMEIEEVATKAPEKVKEVVFDGEAFDEGEFSSSPDVIPIGKKLHELLQKEEAILAEINPLILTADNDLIAVDAKVTIDNNALSRHPSFEHKDIRGYSSLELQAREYGLSYVELQGDIAVIGNGAGLVMATLDALDGYGGKPANFCDIGGGASAELVQQAMRIVLQKHEVRSLFMNVFGGITHCDEVARGIIEFVREEKVKIPLVIRMVGTNEEEANKILEAAGFHVFHSFEEAAKSAVEQPLTS